MTHVLKILILLLVFSMIAIGQNICRSFRPVPGRCDLSGPDKEQAKCLLRPVKKFANLGGPLLSLPAPLDALVGQPTEPTLSVEAVKNYLTRKGIRDQDVGGAVSVRLSAPKYFVIHDTSDFLEDSDNFPGNINDDTWSPNRLARRVDNKICHLYINRLGQSATAIVFESTMPPSGTKFGSCHSDQKKAFLHIENVQPRIRDRAVSFPNDALAPDPGFTDAQLQRLALVYVVASVRTGKWLIPAYHSPIDLGYRNQHDDPQNFNLNKWAEQLNSLIAEIRSSR
jgi:hypothetical protein